MLRMASDSDRLNKLRATLERATARHFREKILLDLRDEISRLEMEQKKESSGTFIPSFDSPMPRPRHSSGMYRSPSTEEHAQAMKLDEDETPNFHGGL